MLLQGLYARAHRLAGLCAADWPGPAAPGAMAQETVRCHEALHAKELHDHIKTRTPYAVNMCLPLHTPGVGAHLAG